MSWDGGYLSDMSEMDDKIKESIKKDGDEERRKSSWDPISGFFGWLFGSSSNNDSD